MTLKTFKRIQMGIAFVLAISFSQAIVFQIWLIPVFLVVVGFLTMLILRRRVTEIIADERDYATGGRAAILSLQIYSWIATICMFILYALKARNPAYEPIAVTLAFSTCILMLLYAAIFKYYNRFKLTDKRWLYTAVIMVLFFFMAIFTLRVFSGEDDWICQGGQWVKHGQPDYPAPVVKCEQ